MANFYIDYENVHNEGLKGVERLTPDDTIYLFYSDKADTLKIDVVQKLLATQGNIRFMKIENGVENALDFQLITALMCDYSADNNYYIISRDKGYDAAINMAQQRDRKEIFRCKDINWALKHMNNEAIDESDPEVITEITDEIEIIQTVEELLSDNDYGENVNGADNNSQEVEAADNKLKPAETTDEIKPEISAEEKDKRSYQSICTKILNTIKINHKVPLNYHQAEQVYKALKQTSTKMEFYRRLNSIMGRKEGSELYQKIKAIYKTLRGIYKASVAAAEMAAATPEAMAAAIEKEPAVREINLEGIDSQQTMMEIVMEALSEEALAGEDVEAEAAAIVSAVMLASKGQQSQTEEQGIEGADKLAEPSARPKRTYRRPRATRNSAQKREVKPAGEQTEAHTKNEEKTVRPRRTYQRRGTRRTGTITRRKSAQGTEKASSSKE
ncbi:hypothetical protein SAMN02745671_01046 [Anaerovibrio lipolyticus DSM 3074]|uniref:PIN-like domain-containing protein n=2 Tax=Anaerovibrio lipolyticus TaxID=82374 RepID=A0A0B2JW62_9FIRM|nr:PIN domain-containing protein [Anaerovibrio lipolyticus]KHM52580.1 hypothetical protein NZ47_04015 [Anaerovibrio lipolyticus]SHI58837.1 hypothetical protein SAMN02745671_01046 [Anaerovibrio lipolyticus DSM 3074]